MTQNLQLWHKLNKFKKQGIDLHLNSLRPAFWSDALFSWNNILQKADKEISYIKTRVYANVRIIPCIKKNWLISKIR